MASWSKRKQRISATQFAKGWEKSEPPEFKKRRPVTIPKAQGARVEATSKGRRS
jgi:hypothetical protein